MYPIPHVRDQEPRTLEIMSHVLHARKVAPSTLETMYFHQKLEKNGITPAMFNCKSLLFQYNTTWQRQTISLLYMFSFSILKLRHSVSD